MVRHQYVVYLRLHIVYQTNVLLPVQSMMQFWLKRLNDLLKTANNQDIPQNCQVKIKNTFQEQGHIMSRELKVKLVTP